MSRTRLCWQISAYSCSSMKRESKSPSMNRMADLQSINQSHTHARRFSLSRSHTHTHTDRQTHTRVHTQFKFVCVCSPVKVWIMVRSQWMNQLQELHWIRTLTTCEQPTKEVHESRLTDAQDETSERVKEGGIATGIHKSPMDGFALLLALCCKRASVQCVISTAERQTSTNSRNVELDVTSAHRTFDVGGHVDALAEGMR